MVAILTTPPPPRLSRGGNGKGNGIACQSAGSYLGNPGLKADSGRVRAKFPLASPLPKAGGNEQNQWRLSGFSSRSQVVLGLTPGSRGGSAF